MEKILLQQLLSGVKNNKISVDEALLKLKNLPFEELGFATIDHHRALRKGHPEVIFCQNKTPHQVLSIALAQIKQEATVFGTRADCTVLEAIRKGIPGVDIDEEARCFWKKSRLWKKNWRSAWNPVLPRRIGGWSLSAN